VSVDSELEQVDAFFALEELVLESDTDVGGALGEESRAPPIVLLVRQQDVQVVVRLRPGHVQGAPLCLNHQNNQDQVTGHVDDRKCHHDCILEVVANKHEESDNLENEVKAPKELVGVPLLRETPLVLIDHEEAAEEPGGALESVKNDEIVVIAPIYPG